MKVLLTGWFSLEEGGATAGDVFVRDVVCGWLDEHGIDYEIAQQPAYGPGVDWFRVPPSRYTHVIFATGPVGGGLAVAALLERFSGCRLVGLNVSVIDEEAPAFDLLLERDGANGSRADLAWAAPIADPPVVAIVRVHRQSEYRGSNPDAAHAAFDRLLANRPAAAYTVDTVLDPRTPGRRTPAEVESLIARADVVLTTRLHGLVMALRRGVPAIAIDPVPRGAKVIAQARFLNWPAAMTVDDIDDAVLAGHFAWCVTPEARARAESCRRRAAATVEDVRNVLEEELGFTQPVSGLIALDR